ncbi:Clp protease N-terminal domain-containing protein [Nocardia altamirensis]|uniref:Clp protease N-terminal domain-containing protein n=1 Tax=Nocardia altamirensis TaxID=472158 RepID=UPI00084056BC|nr:Clp protease N-terminal domain-containing protein [Nocardia altamirensis]
MDLLNLGASEANRLQQGWIAPEHTVLGILRGDPDDIARRALEQAGLDTTTVENSLKRIGSAETGDGLSPNLRWYTVHGRAEGIACAFGAAEPGAVHFVLAVLWDRTRWLFADIPGPTREEVVAALVGLGVELPRAPLPELELSTRMDTYVEFPRRALDDVLALLTTRHPPGDGLTWGFNYKDDETAYVRAEAGIDVQAIVAEALA